MTDNTTKLVPPLEGGPYRAEGNAVKAMAGGRWYTVASTNSKHLTDEGCRNNARYIAKALNIQGALVEALEESAGHLDQLIQDVGGCDHSVGICCCDVVRSLEKVRAALALARGDA